MTKPWTGRGSLIVAVSVLCGPVAFGQEAPEFVNARPVWENARGGAVSARRPGRMVQMGNQRFQEAHGFSLGIARRGPEITETAPLVDEDSALRAGLITSFFDSIDPYLDLLSTLIGGGGLPDGDPPGGDAPDLSDLLGTITDES